ncbi:polysaccharide biosynthesis protein [Chania multitudinisentens]|uniref:polysaccharide biosynthesis protein n=1 Tax=Chania multitudinisentens TaxID=1639108 RepID=UPI0003E140E3|nr:nucleoside-diphosphate sugar epimerase/dehydratase [Chania multitudinisentens]
MTINISSWSRTTKQMLIIAADCLLLPFSLWASIGLRLNSWDAANAYSWWIFFLPSLVAIPIFIRMGLYRAVIRFLGDRAMITILLAVSISVMVFAGVYAFLGLPNIPRGALTIYWVLSTFTICVSRFVARIVLHQLEYQPGRRRVIIYGAGNAGQQLAMVLRINRNYHPVAFVDDEIGQRGLAINGITVYSPDRLESLIHKFDVSEVMLAMPSAPHNHRIEIINKLVPLHVRVQVVPSFVQIMGGKVKMSDVREVEVDELLGRDAVPPDQHLLAANIVGKAVMVTGAGGSIGSELCRQILANRPSILVLYELSEFALYNIERELRLTVQTHKLDIKVLPMLGSVQNEERLANIMRQYGIQTMYHAAAYKHVPLVECNMIEGVVNNVFGTQAAALAAISANVETFVLISTDKAVRPTNVMGASKRMAELVLQSLASDSSVPTRFSIVRFGNVLGSSGSVVPLFRQQIAHGGPITVTHPEIIRYFMTIPEASQLVIQAGALGGNGEVFVLDMGEPVKIIDLACRMVNLSGFTVKDTSNPFGDIEIIFTGLRPGEKLYEELLIGGDVTGTSHPRIMKAHESYLSRPLMDKVLVNLSKACSNNQLEAIRQILLEYVAGYSPKCDIIDYLPEPKKFGPKSRVEDADDSSVISADSHRNSRIVVQMPMESHPTQHLRAHDAH